MQREPAPQSLSARQYFAPLTLSRGTLLLTSPEFISIALQFPFTHITPGLQSVSNTQARAGVEVKQRTVTMAMPRIVDALFGSLAKLTPQECPNSDREAEAIR
jgi:hypothetical protein